MCDKNNVEEIVLEMLTYLEIVDYFIKEEMVMNNVETLFECFGF